jgi:transposase
MIALDMLPESVRPLVRDHWERLEKSLQERDQIIRDQKQRLQLQEEKIRWLNLKLWGPKGERLSPDQTLLLLAEASVTEAEVEREASLPPAVAAVTPAPKAKAPRPNHPGREKLPEHLERREVIIACHPQDCRCEECGAERPVIGYETSEELACEPARFYVRVIQREKRGSHCLPEHGVATAPAPAKILPKSKLANETIIEALVQKYQQHQPIYRFCAALAQNHGVELSRQTVTGEVLAVGDLLRSVVGALATQLAGGPYLQADETPVPVQTGEKTGRNHRAYLWQYSVPGGPVVFDFQMGRGRDGPKTFLKHFRGILQSDGYAAYDDLGEGIVHAGCLTHLRRGFVEALKLAPENPLPAEIIERLKPLYAAEQAAREQGLDAAARKALRQEKSVPLMQILHTRLQEIRQQIAPGGKLAQACDYALRQWRRVIVFLEHGEVEIDTNWCEGGMRPVALGRKNWLHIGSPQAGPKVAAIASIVETCRRLDINLRDYLNDVLPKLGDWPITRVAELTPTAWKTAHQKTS